MIDLNQLNFNEYDTDKILDVMSELTDIVQEREFIELSKKFNKKNFDKKYKELLKNPPTKFVCKNGVIMARKELVRNVLVTIRHLTQEFDVFMLFVGREGSGKSKFVRQLNYIYWYLMRELGLIDYDYNLGLVHFGIKDLQEDRRQHDEKGFLFRISILDESKDDLGRDKHMSPEAKHFIDYMRRCRDESGIISLLLPQLSELMPRITLSRAVFIFEVDYDLDKVTGDIIRGDYGCYIIPRGKTGHSYYHNKEIPTSTIKSELADYLYTTRRQFESLPKKCLFFQGNFNNVDPIDVKEYKLKKRAKKWERLERQDMTKKLLQRYEKIAQDFRTLILALKAQDWTNQQIGDLIGKSEATIRRYLQQAEKSSSTIDT